MMVILCSSKYSKSKVSAKTRLFTCSGALLSAVSCCLLAQTWSLSFSLSSCRFYLTVVCRNKDVGDVSSNSDLLCSSNTDCNSAVVMTSRDGSVVSRARATHKAFCFYIFRLLPQDLNPCKLPFCPVFSLLNLPIT